MARTQKTGPDAHCDVLVFVNQGGAINALWNVLPPLPPGVEEGGSSRIPEQAFHRMDPGLSFVPGVKWAKVEASTSYKDGFRRGLCKAMAGHHGDLDGDWAKLRPPSIATMVLQTSTVSALLRLQVMEGEADSPRLDVSEDLELRLDDLKIAVAKHAKKRKAKRRGNRRMVV